MIPTLQRKSEGLKEVARFVRTRMQLNSDL